MKDIKNKVLKVALIAGTSLCMTGCADFLDIKPLNLVTEDNYWDERNDVEQMMLGCYTRMQEYDFLSRALVWGELRSDNVYMGTETLTKDYSVYQILRENLLANNAYTTWTPFYSVINRCNLIIEQAPKVAAKDPSYTESDVRATQAEAKALRALCYFYLIRTFRDVPYYTHPITADNQKLDYGVTDFDTILGYLIDDLEDCKGQALKNYSNESNNRLRVTRNFIYALLADMYLWKQDYPKAAECCQYVIDAKMNEYESDNSYGGNGATVRLYGRTVDTQYPLVADGYTSSDVYGFSYSYLFGTGASFESLLELDFDSEVAAGVAKNAVIANFYSGYNDKNVWTDGFVAPASSLANDVNSDAPTYFTSNRDARIKMFMRSVTSGGASANVTVAKYAYSNVQIDEDRKAAYMLRFVNDANWIFYRLTDVMLMKAEALACMMLDNPSESEEDQNYDRPLRNEAFDLVYAVNIRSLMGLDAQDNHADKLDPARYTTKTLLLRLILAERRRELLFEGKRWFDLVRQARREGNTQSLREAVKVKFESEATSADQRLARMDAIYWPINKDELKINPNLKQNPAYGSADDNSYETTK